MNRKNELVDYWIKYAEADLTSANLINQKNPEFAHIVVFHCQQSIEKIIKAYLTQKEIRFKKIHDLNKLLAMLESENWFSASFYENVDMFEKFNIEVRYPDAEIFPTKEDAKLALENAEKFVTIVRKNLQTK